MNYISSTTIFLGLVLVALFLLVIFFRQRNQLNRHSQKKDEELNSLKKKLEIQSTQLTQFHTILNGMMEGVLVTGPEGKIILANPSFYRVVGIEQRSEGKTPLEILRYHEIEEALKQALDQGSTQETEIHLRNHNGGRSILVYVTPLSASSDSQGAILVFFEVTKLRRLENARKDFVANVSHELRTPLTSIRGFAETLLAGALKEAETSERFVKKIQRNASQLQNLIDDLLRLSEIESGREEFHPIKIELQSVFDEIQNFFLESAHQKSQTLMLADVHGLSAVADPSALKQILLNLVENAIRYTPEGGTIRLAAQLDGEFYRISVSDSGLGIPKEKLPQIFERFYRVDKARSREMGGTGLGLAIVKHLVQSQGGEVDVKSIEGKGSEFSFTLPVVEKKM